MTTARRRGSRAATLLTLMAIAVGACGAATATPVRTADGAQRVEVAYAGGVVTGGVARWAVPVGGTVELVVRSDVADEVHVHGYDRLSYVTAGASTTVRFVADLPGTFDVELEQRGSPLAHLEVS